MTKPPRTMTIEFDLAALADAKIAHRKADPIAQLIDSIRSIGRPQIAWVTRWSSGGTREPLAAAWLASKHSTAMIQLLDLVNVPVPMALGMVASYPISRTDEEMAPVVRNHYPQAPCTLQELLDLLAERKVAAKSKARR